MKAAASLATALKILAQRITVDTVAERRALVRQESPLAQLVRARSLNLHGWDRTASLAARDRLVTRLERRLARQWGVQFDDAWRRV